jgi:thiamine-monophosphate kinase
VHFDRRWLDLPDVGWRSFMAAASDLAAMAARPLAALSSLVLPRGTGARAITELGRGQAAAARALGCPVVGGNIARGSELSITTVVLGRAHRPLLRSGARVGDALWLLGDVGSARAGLLLLERAATKAAIRRTERAMPGATRCIAAWRRPRARIDQGLDLAGRAHSAIDVSDGLGGDAGHLARSSQVRIVIEERRLRPLLSRSLVAVSRALGVDPLDVAIRGGEDYALLATGPTRLRPASARAIGHVEAGAGVVLELRDGKTRSLGRGFDHLRA